MGAELLFLMPSNCYYCDILVNAGWCMCMKCQQYVVHTECYRDYIDQNGGYYYCVRCNTRTDVNGRYETNKYKFNKSNLLNCINSINKLKTIQTKLVVNDII
jgi:hypothetical protein